MTAYYNEIDPYAAQWLRNLIAKGLIADGEVDERSIVDVRPADLAGFTQCHFFAGIGGWSHALRLAGWPDDRPIWTGSCPCQPFSVAGKGAGVDDPRHLWPHFHRLISSIRPPVVVGEQVSGQAGYGWLDGVRSDLEAEKYACRGVDIPACAVDAPHIRSRLYWVASDMADATRELPYGSRREGGGRPKHSNRGHLGDANNAGLERQLRHGDDGSRWSGEARPVAEASGGHMADTDSADIQARGSNGLGVSTEGPHDGSVARCRDDDDFGNVADAECRGREGEAIPTANEAAVISSQNGAGSFWSDHIWLTGSDGKARRAQPGIPLLAHGIPNRVGKLRAYGNAIVPQVAAEVIKAFMETQS